jgi:hypothetical protein
VDSPHSRSYGSQRKGSTISAYISNPETFGILAAYATLNKCAIYDWRQDSGISIETAQRIAKGLASENIRSVAHHYPDDMDNLPGPALSVPEIYEAAALYAESRSSQ